MKTKSAHTKQRVRGSKPPAGRSGRKRAKAADAGIVPALLDIRSILVPTDFSPDSEKALAYAVAFARQFGARLTLLHVVEPIATPDFVRSFPLVMENDKLMAECRRHLDGVIRHLEIEPKLIEKALVRYGRAFHEITNAARTLKADLIILSTHGYTGLKHALLGSTAERVVRHAPCPVLVVRPTERELVPE